MSRRLLIGEQIDDAVECPIPHRVHGELHAVADEPIRPPGEHVGVVDEAKPVIAGFRIGLVHPGRAIRVGAVEDDLDAGEHGSALPCRIGREVGERMLWVPPRVQRHPSVQTAVARGAEGGERVVDATGEQVADGDDAARGGSLSPDGDEGIDLLVASGQPE